MARVAEIEELEEVKGSEEDETTQSDTFFDRLQAFTPTQWDRDLMLYLYRLEPRRPGTDKNPNIRRYTSPVGVDEIKAKYGSGKYQFILNQRDEKNRKKNRTIENYVFEIEDPDFPPVMPGLDGWENDPENKRWAGWTKKPTESNAEGTDSGVLAKALVDLARERSQRPDNQAESKTIDKVIDMFGKAGEKSVELALSQVKQQDPQTFLQLIAALKQLMPAPTNNDPLIALMMKQLDSVQAQLLEERKANRDMLQAILTRKEEKTDPLSSFDKILGVFGKLDELRGGGPAEAGGIPRGKWGWVAPYIPDALQIVGKFADGFGRTAAAAPGSLPTSNPTTATNQPQPGSSKAQQPAAEQEKQMQYVQQMMFGQAVEAFGRGIRGGDYAISFVDVWGPVAFAQVQQLGVERLMDTLRGAPFWPQLQPREGELIVFVRDFVEQAEYEETPPAPEVIPPAPKTSRKGGAK